MLAFLTDEDFQGGVVRALRHQRADLDVVRVQEVGLMGQPDSVILEWAAQHQRVLLTHDVNTMTKEAYARATAGLPMPLPAAVNPSLYRRQYTAQQPGVISSMRWPSGSRK